MGGMPCRSQPCALNAEGPLRALQHTFYDAAIFLHWRDWRVIQGFRLKNIFSELVSDLFTAGYPEHAEIVKYLRCITAHRANVNFFMRTFSCELFPKNVSAQL